MFNIKSFQGSSMVTTAMLNRDVRSEKRHVTTSCVLLLN